MASSPSSLFDHRPQAVPRRFPSWLHRPMPRGGALAVTQSVIATNRLHTVCEEAKCPNIQECYSHHTATFLVMGRECTRACGFCDIATSATPPPLDEGEPAHVAASVEALGLKHVVITMVARDDLPDGGAAHLVRVVEEVRQRVPGTTIELLTSDLGGSREAIDTVLAAQPAIFNHNLETVRRLTPRVRHRATYERSLDLLGYVHAQGRCLTKSGLMVGLGESKEEVLEAMRDLRQVGCDILTIGQYLQASRKKLRVVDFVEPALFAAYEQEGLAMGFRHVYAGPFVRSSYHAEQAYSASA